MLKIKVRGYKLQKPVGFKNVTAGNNSENRKNNFN